MNASMRICVCRMRNVSINQARTHVHVWMASGLMKTPISVKVKMNEECWRKKRDCQQS